MSVLRAIEVWRHAQLVRGWPDDDPMPYRMSLNEAREFLQEVGQMGLMMGGPGEPDPRTLSDEELRRRMRDVRYMGVPLEVAR